jgi:two-component system, sensor histidine kinase and response regulator
VGIAKQKQRAIFEAFTQADSSMTRKYGGTGLDLAITAKLVGIMDGRIWMESEEGCGTAFHVTMALHPEQLPHETGVIHSGREHR